MLQTEGKSKQIVRASKGGGDLAIKNGDEAGLTIHKVASRLKLMINNGSVLSDAEAMALAQYSIATGLNPFNQECWYLPGKGPGPGIAGYRRRGQEQLYWEAEKAGNRAPEACNFWFEHVELTEGDRFFHPEKGDIRYRAILHDSLTREAWERRILSHLIEFTKAGFQAREAMELAKDLVGPEPVWYAEATVEAGESFAKEGRPDKWDRRERCQKRAEKWALKKRFNLQIPEPIGWDVDAIDATFITQELPASTPNHTEGENLAALGFGEITHTPPQEPKVITFTPPMPDDPTSAAIFEDAALNKPDPPAQIQNGATNGTPVVRPYPPLVMRDRLADKAKQYKGQAVSDTLRKVVASCLDQIFDGNPAKRHQVTEWLTGSRSTKDIPAEFIHAIATDWLEVAGFNDPPNPVAMQEARQVLTEIQIAAGQLTLKV